MPHIFYTLLILVSSLSLATGTPQCSDTLIHKGKSYSVLGFRFAPTLNKKLYKLSKQDNRWIYQSSLWRGYQAVFQIRNDELFLIGINFNCHEPKPSPLEILGFAIPEDGVRANFFTGDLFYGFGENWGYLHNSSQGEKHKTIKKFTFDRGVLKSITEVKSKKPVQLIQDQILKDIEMLSEAIQEIQLDDPFTSGQDKINSE